MITIPTRIAITNPNNHPLPWKNEASPHTKQHKVRLQARGKARREDLLTAALELYEVNEIDDVSYKDIYERAGLLPRCTRRG